jgi:cell division protein FtsB
VRIPEKYWLGLVVTLGVAILAWALFGPQGLREVRRLRTERRELIAEIDRLKAERLGLEKTVARLRRDPRAIESRARDDLGMIRKGETVFLLPEHDAPGR